MKAGLFDRRRNTQGGIDRFHLVIRDTADEFSQSVFGARGACLQIRRNAGNATVTGAQNTVSFLERFKLETYFAPEFSILSY